MPILKEIERRYADRVPNAKTQTALNEDTREARRYKSSSQLLKALKENAGRTTADPARQPQ